MAITRISAASFDDMARAIACREANLLINSSYRIAQVTEGAGSSTVSATTHAVADQWGQAWSLTTNTAYAGRGGSPGYGWPHYAYMAPGASVPTFGTATDYMLMEQKIETARAFELRWGTTSARDLRVGAWLSAVDACTVAMYIRNAAGTRSYVHEIPLAASTWTWSEFVIPGDTTGSWETTLKNHWGSIGVCPGAGSNFDGTNDTWASANYITTANCTAPWNAAAEAFLMGGIFAVPAELEFPKDATAFNSATAPYMFKTPDAELQECQRYVCKSYNQGTALATTAAYAGCGGWIGLGTNNYHRSSVFYFPVPMRTGPTITLYSPNSGTTGKAYAATDVDAAAYNTGSSGMGITINNVSTSNSIWHCHWFADARM